MGKNVKFGDIEIQKQRFHLYKEAILMENIHINKIVVSNKVSFRKKGFKYFIGYKDAKKIRPLCIFLPKISAYRKVFHRTKYMCFLLQDDELLGKYNEVWKKIPSKKNLIVNQYIMKNI